MLALLIAIKEMKVDLTYMFHGFRLQNLLFPQLFAPLKCLSNLRLHITCVLFLKLMSYKSSFIIPHRWRVFRLHQQ